MTEKDILRVVMEERGYSQTLLAEKANLKRQSNVSEMLRSKNLRVDNLVRLLKAMDCELIVRSTTKDKKEWKIEIEEV